jgi:hypothetical protein
VGSLIFDLKDERWRFRARRERLLKLFVPPFTAALAVLVTIRFWILDPSTLELSLVLWAILGTMFAIILVVTGGGDPETLTITPTTLEFARKGRPSFTIRLDKQKVAATLLDQSAEPAVKMGRRGAFPLYLASFSQAIEQVPLTAEAFTALRSELPLRGLVLSKAGPVPMTRNTVRYVYRKGYGSDRPLTIRVPQHPLPP